ncbi:MAG TPA: TlpA disulfide reductase family protein [Acidimicrobiia bacterium]
MSRAVLVGGAVVLALAAGAALAFTLGEGEDQGADLSQIPAPIVSGLPLPALDPTTAADPAVGLSMPEARGVDFELSPVEIVEDGLPKVILFLAHHCPHCQVEVPKVQEWLDGGGRPEGVSFYSVATSIDDLLPNYPPDTWLEREGWTVPVLVDTENSVAQAYGLTAFPFWVFVDEDGVVRGRVASELPQESLTELFSLLLP